MSIVEEPIEVLVCLELGEFGGALTLDEFDDFHGGFQADGGGGPWDH